MFIQQCVKVTEEEDKEEGEEKENEKGGQEENEEGKEEEVKAGRQASQEMEAKRESIIRIAGGVWEEEDEGRRGKMGGRRRRRNRREGSSRETRERSSSIWSLSLSVVNNKVTQNILHVLLGVPKKNSPLH